MLKAEDIVQMARDAERYRWLRNGDNDELVTRPYAYGSYLLRRDELDAAIDAALEQEQQ